VIVLAVRWYLRFGLSYRDVEELLAERGIKVGHVTVYRWVQHDQGRGCRGRDRPGADVPGGA
jgi:transposase, IS6 family